MSNSKSSPLGINVCGSDGLVGTVGGGGLVDLCPDPDLRVTGWGDFESQDGVR